MSATTQDIGMPAAVDAERTILGAILLENAAHIEVAEKLDADDFSLDSHKRIYHRISELAAAKRPIDIVTLSHELTRHKEIEAVGGVAYLASLSEGLPRRPVISAYVAIVKEKALARRLMSIGSQLVERAADGEDTALAVAESLQEHLQGVMAGSQASQLIRAGDYLAQNFPTPGMMLEKAARTQGIRTGFQDFDRMTAGLQRGELVIIGARPSMGKTSYGVRLLETSSIDQNLTAVMFSLEMGREAILARLICSRGRVEYQRYKGGVLSPHELGYFSTAHEDLAFAPLYIDDTPALALSQIRNSCRALKARLGKLDIVEIDHLGLMSTDGAPKKYDRAREVGWLTAGLKDLAKELDVPVVLLCQLSRANMQRSDKRPMLSDLRESGNIEQDGDLIAFLHREAYYEPKDEGLKGKAEIIISKQRNGPTGTVNVAYDGPIMRWSDELEYREQAGFAEDVMWGSIK